MDRAPLIIQYAYKRENYQLAAEMFESLGGYLDSVEKARECRKKAQDTAEEEKIWRYERADRMQKEASNGDDLNHCAEEFGLLGDYRDSAQRRQQCQDLVRAGEKKERKKAAAGGIAVLLLVTAAVVCAATGMVRYLIASGYYAAGSYSNAYTEFSGLGDFMNSREMAERSEFRGLKEAKVGSDTEYGLCTWKVLETTGDELLLIVSNFGSITELGRMAFNETEEDTAWETSSLREWLNGEFFEMAFSDTEKAHILAVKSQGSSNEEYGTAYTESTEDLVTILSVEETEKYHKTAVSLGLDWWLRTPGNDMGTAAFQSALHEPVLYGCPVTQTAMAVRPVIRITCGE